ncbi:MAG: zinc ribbon-containing protein [bacterium]|nr:zinc ribbon-containing protein [bacterium]
MPRCGQKPGKGTYTCIKCGTTVTLDDATDTLPPCPKCHGCDYR